MRESAKDSNLTPHPVPSGSRAVGISKARRIKANSVAGFDLDRQADVPEHELLESNQHLKQAQELAGLATWEQNLQTNDITLSRQSYEMFGLDPALPNPDIETFLSRVHNEDRIRLRELVRHMLQARENRLSTNLRVALDDGSNRVVHMLSEVIWSDDGRPLKLIGITQDITERFAAAERLEHSTKLLQRAQEMAQIGSWEQDSLMGEVSWSRELFRLMGMDPDNDRASDAEFISAMTPESWAEIQRERAIALATHPTARAYNIRIRRRDGAERILLNRVEYTWSEDGTLLRSEGTCQDITDQIEAAERLEQSERELRESNQHLRQAQQLAHLGSWEHDVVNDKVKWSAELYEMFGLDPQTEVPSAELFFSKLHPTDRVALHEQFSATQARKGTSMAADFRITRADGSERILHELSEFIWSDDGRLLRQIGTMWDVTEQRAAAEKLLHSERLLNRAQEVANIGSWDHNDLTGEINWSRNFFSILGLDPEVDRPSMDLFFQVVHPEDREMVSRRYEDALRNRVHHATYDARILHRDGSTHMLRFNVEYFWPEVGDLSRMNGTGQDITEQLAAEAALKQALLAAQSADRAKSGFLANMSHELRTPLNAIIGFADILASEKMSPSMTERDREYAKDIRDSGMHLLEIINDVLDFSRFEAGTGEIRDERIDVAALFAWVVKLLGDKARGKDLSLTTKVSKDAGAFRGDLRLIRQALLNVVGNAIKFTLTGGIAIAAARTTDGELVISVADTGIGMESENIPAALTPFTQLENSLQRQYEGVGLGLPLAKRFVELHGGSFEIESAPGEGTVVSIVLPEWRGRDFDDAR